MDKNTQTWRAGQVDMALCLDDKTLPVAPVSGVSVFHGMGDTWT
jgi:hypothetical protein